MLFVYTVVGVYMWVGGWVYLFIYLLFVCLFVCAVGVVVVGGGGLFVWVGVSGLGSPTPHSCCYHSVDPDPRNHTHTHTHTHT
jgi:hypothetical protein